MNINFYTSKNAVKKLFPLLFPVLLVPSYGFTEFASGAEQSRETISSGQTLKSSGNKPLLGESEQQRRSRNEASSGSTAKSNASSEQRWSLNQQNADIREFITQIAQITGETFVIDPRIKGGNTVTVISSKPLTKNQVYDVFLEVLTTNGYTVIPKGKVLNIVPSTTAKTVGQEKDKGHSSIMTTRVIELHSVSAIEVIPIIRPLIAQYGHAAASASSNAVIVSDLEDNVDRISNLIKELDDTSNNDYEVIQLQHAWVGDVAKIIQETLHIGKGQFPSGLQVISDERSNRLIIKGNASKRTRVRKLVVTLDKEGTRKSTTKVMFISYGDAKNLAEILSEASEALQDTQGRTGISIGSSNSSMGHNRMPGQMKSDDKSKQSQNVFVKADESQNALIMIAAPETLQAMEQIIRQLDRPRAQVLLEAAIVEVVGDINDALGIQWGIDGRNTVAARGDHSLSLSSLTGHLLDNKSISMGSLALRENNFGVLVHALSKQSNSNILSTPSILTIDNQEAEFLVGENIPIKTGAYQTASQKDSTNPFTTTERKDIGIKLKLTPHIGEGSSMRLELQQEISSRRSTADSSAGGDIIYDNRTLKTAVIVDDGKTVVIGGLIQDDRQTAKNKVPLFGDIPVLGNLFKYNNHGSKKRNLMLFIRPTVMRNSETLARVSQDRFTNLKLLGGGAKNTVPGNNLPATAEKLFDAEAFDLRKSDKAPWVP
ncbi:MAG: type II secretion system secretin GspD [Candidatus Endonucleobacter bathymodioli]|uniref:Type II secretion system secretin GspD n=1 Tax=Candidatus Endonucleibacter bathymodioli TaxID=539814 RepID=A0AA90NSM3_9GAMM|nr:type II secretion system secretin GspD [Candidatus Endonucleobacter bathymodioli]